MVFLVLFIAFVFFPLYKSNGSPRKNQAHIEKKVSFSFIKEYIS